MVKGLSGSSLRRNYFVGEELVHYRWYVSACNRPIAVTVCAEWLAPGGRSLSVVSGCFGAGSSSGGFYEETRSVTSS